MKTAIFSLLLIRDFKKNKQASNEVLVKNISKGDFSSLYYWLEERKNKYYKIGWSYLHNLQDIEDLFHNSLLKAFENIGQLREPKYFEIWFTSILINECKAIIRKRKKLQFSANNQMDISFNEDFSIIELKQMLNKLPEIYKEVLVLKYISGYTQEDIALMLNIPIGTVKSRVYRGLRDLRGLLGKEED